MDLEYIFLGLDCTLSIYAHKLAIDTVIHLFLDQPNESGNKLLVLSLNNVIANGRLHVF